MPQCVCRHCIHRIQLFDKFCDEVVHNQEVLRSSKSKNQNHSTSLIQLSSGNVPFANENGTFIITVANTHDIVAIDDKKPNDDNLIDVIHEEQIICSETSIKPNTINIEQELDDLASTDIAAELRGESENDDGCDEDEDEAEDENGDEDSPSNNGDIDDSTHLQYKNFPTKILDGCKLLYKGPDLLNMISQFYRLECDQCE